MSNILLLGFGGVAMIAAFAVVTKIWVSDREIYYYYYYYHSVLVSVRLPVPCFFSVLFFLPVMVNKRFSL